MGYTPGGGQERGRLAFVLINRVNEIADRYSTARSLVLGAAIAHELGHLLISKEHTNAGIMKAYLNQSDFHKARKGELRLTAEQAWHIRNSSARVAPSEHVADNLLVTAVDLLRQINIDLDSVRVTTTDPWKLHRSWKAPRGLR